MKLFAMCDETTGEVITIGFCSDADLALQSAPPGQVVRERAPYVRCGWTWNGETFDPPTED